MKIRLREVKMKNQNCIARLLAQFREKVRSCSIHTLRRYLIDLPLERYGLNEYSHTYLFISEKIAIARVEYDRRSLKGVKSA
ncbi:MAG: hypothetical protein Q8J85_00560 [Sulfuricurvum sp.]|nr:hypothetical protein [Sulfuricurvum sp.]MDP3022676.1 hypothetical protein [Sulfuricurvum sp.]